MLATKLSFNLLHRPWIPCTALDGESEELGLLDVFERASELRDFAALTPLARISLYRLLLAILYRTQRIDEQPDAVRLLRDGWDGEAIRNHLTKWEERFDLFSERTPFFQRADLNFGDKQTPITKFSPEFTAGNNKQLFDHSGDEDPPAVSFAEAARLLILCQGWSIGGGISGGGRPRFTTAALARGISVVPLGSNLAETLLLNLVPFENLTKNPRAIHSEYQQDMSAWERAGGDPIDQRPVDGPADYLTWQYRYIRLLPESDGSSVRFAYYAQGEKIEEAADGVAILDPFHPFTNKDGIYFPCGVSKERAAWRDAESLLRTFDEGKQSSASLVSLAGLRYESPSLSQSAALPVLVAGIAIPGGQPPPDLWVGDVFHVPPALLKDRDVFVRLQDSLAIAQQVAGVLKSAVYFYASEFLKHENGGVDKEAARRFADSLCREDDYWAALETRFHVLLPHLADDGYDARYGEWLEAVKAAACDAFDSSLASQNSTGRHLRAVNAARGFFHGSRKGMNSIIKKEDTNG